jgi:hypothetical protein
MGTYAAARMLMCGVGDGYGLWGLGEGLSGCGGSGSMTAGKAKWLFVVFYLLCGWCYGEFD